MYFSKLFNIQTNSCLSIFILDTNIANNNLYVIQRKSNQLIRAFRLYSIFFDLYKFILGLLKKTYNKKN
jgi:hypothetical protein